MPLYFFGLNDQPPTEDSEVLPDDNAARRLAEQVADEIGRNGSSQPRIGVYDANGKRIS